MNEQFKTNSIVLRRQSYGEADRIITFITPEYGKISAIVKGARRLQSKMAAGIELLSENELTLLKGRGELHTVISARQLASWDGLLDDYENLQVAYELVKLCEESTEEGEGQNLYDILCTALYGLNNKETHSAVVQVWYFMQLLRLHGQQPDLAQDKDAHKLVAGRVYHLDREHGVLEPIEGEGLDTDQIKLWRVCLTNDLGVVAGIGGVQAAAQKSLPACREFVHYRLSR